MSESTSPPPSPIWTSGTKLIVGLTFVGILVALLIYFRSIIGPLLLAIILAYVLHPVAGYLHQKTRLNWRWSVNIVFVLFVLILVSILAVSGIAIVQQMQSLISQMIHQQAARIIPRFLSLVSICLRLTP